MTHDYKAALEALQQLSWGYFCPVSMGYGIRAGGYTAKEKAQVTASCLAALELAIKEQEKPDSFEMSCPVCHQLHMVNFEKKNAQWISVMVCDRKETP